jgi:hypothetical protein
MVNEVINSHSAIAKSAIAHRHELARVNIFRKLVPQPPQGRRFAAGFLHLFQKLSTAGFT